ncbi:hypothetical protein D3C86_1263250 [compost metagenome]
MRPGQAVAAVHVPGNAVAQGHRAVVQGDLRYRAEEEFTGGFKRGHFWNQKWRQACAQYISHGAFGGDEREDPVGGGHQLAGEGDAFGFIGVEQAGLGTATQHRREFPGEVNRVADTGVHALATGGAVHMGGVAQ